MARVVTAPAGAARYVTLARWRAADLARARLDGVEVDRRPDGTVLRLASPDTLHDGVADEAGGRPCWWGSVEPPPLEPATPWDTAIVSWGAITPPHTWLRVTLRVRLADGRWTRRYTMAVWASGSETIQRHSVEGQDDADARVLTDTLQLRPDRTGRAVQPCLELVTADPSTSPEVRWASVMTSDSRREPAGLPLTSDRAAWGTDLPVPRRSQRVHGDPIGGWCSPTATAMVLGWWGHAVGVADAAEATHDAVYGGTGNWTFNTAWAATFGLDALVTRLGSLAQVERWIAAGVPVVLSLAFRAGELPGAPIDSTDGHLIVVRGFDAVGDVIVNDPAGRSDDDVRRVYPRRALERLWLRSSGGTVYLIHPPGHPAPEPEWGSW